MKYIDYMNEFTVSDETKETVFQSIKQRADQPVKSESRTAAPIVPSEKKKNTFRLHPIRWVAIFVSIVLVLTVTPLAIFFGVGITRSIKLEYMKDLMVDVEGVTGYSIRQDVESTQSESAVQKTSSVSLLSGTLVDEEIETSTSGGYYLYSTKADVESGNLEYNISEVEKVVFFKNKEVREDVRDQNGNPIDVGRKITQDELDAQINKLYTTKEYTYVQFVAKVPESGPYRVKDAEGKYQDEYVYLRSARGMDYDEQGVAAFDKVNYFSSELTASFVIDNATGYIYKIENFVIDGFQNGFVAGYSPGESGGFYSVNTDENHNLVFMNVMPNEDVGVQNVLKDNYGWTYVLNDSINEVDAERKITYTTDGEKYVYDSDRNVYLWDRADGDYLDGNGNVLFHFSGQILTHKMVDGEAVEFENEGIIRDLWSLGNGYLNNSSYLLGGMYGDISVYRRNGSSKSMGLAAFHWKSGGGISVDGDGYWLDDTYNTLIAFDSEGRLYYKQLDLEDYRDKSVTFTVDSDFIRLSDRPMEKVNQYYMWVGHDRYFMNDVYRYVGVNETAYYHIVKTTTGLELVELTTISYAPNVFIFQPINK